VVGELVHWAIIIKEITIGLFGIALKVTFAIIEGIYIIVSGDFNVNLIGSYFI